MSYEQQLQQAVLSGAKGFIAELSDTWEAVGLQEFQIKERLSTVESMIQSVCTDMLNRERHHKEVVARACQDLRAEESLLRRKLEVSECEDAESESAKNVTLTETHRNLTNRISGLYKKRDEVMKIYRESLARMFSLAEKLDCE